jgi:hypothetical protein
VPDILDRPLFRQVARAAKHVLPSLTERRRRMQELEAELTAARTEIATIRLELAVARTESATILPELTAARTEIATLTLERAHYMRLAADLEAHNVVVTSAATKYARRLQGHVDFEANTTDLPSILIFSIPKSGTVFTGQMLSRGLGVELVSLTVGSFPRYLFDLPRLVQFTRGGKVSTEHLDASSENIQMLDAFIDRWVVHIRDPRSVVLSWVHNLDRLHRERDSAPHHLLYVCPTPPERYFELSLSDQVDWNIDHFLPNAMTWIRTWLEVHDSGRHKILLTTFSDIIASENDYLLKILDFYGIPRDRFRRPVIDKTVAASHFRVGREDEWRDCFTPDQLARCKALIGRELMERFGWPD